MNPFESLSQLSGSYSSFVYRQVSSMKVGDAIEVDLGGKSIPDFRMTIRYVSQRKMGGAKFKTKISTDGSLWVKRIS